MMAAQKTTPDIQTRAHKRAFFVSLFDLSWRLLGAMLLPLFVGLYIDSRMSGDGQGFAVGGFFVGMVCGVFAMRYVVKSIAGTKP